MSKCLSKVIAAGIAIVMACASFGAVFSAAGTTVTEGAITQEQVDALGTNLLNGANAVWMVKGDNGEYTEKETADQGNMASLTDGVVGSAADHADSWAGAGTRLVFDLGKKYVIDKALMWSFYVNWGDLCIGEYAMYVGTDKDNLFNDVNKVYTHDNTGKFNDKVDGEGAAQIIEFAAPSVGQYFGIEIVKVTGSTDNTIRITEVGAYGEEYVEKQINLLSSVPVSIFRTPSDDEPFKVDKNAVDNAARTALSDGDADTTAVIDGKGDTIDIIYNLGKKMKTAEIGFTNAGDDASKYVNEMSIYVGATEDAVWTDAARLETYSRGSKTDKTVSFKYNDAKEFRYIRFSVTKPADSGNVLTLAELFAKGTDDQAYTNSNLVLNLPEDKILAYIDEGDKYAETAVNNGASKFPDNPKKEIVDGNANLDGSKHVEIWSGDATLVFDLGDQKLINKAEYTDIIGRTDLWPASYSIYVGNSIEELFGAAAVPEGTYTYPVAEGDGTVPDADNPTKALEFSPAIGQYVRIAFHFTNGQYPRINEIAIYGADVDDVEYEGTDPNVAKSFADEKLGIKVDILKLDGADLYRDAKEMVIAERELTAKEKEALTDLGLTAYTKMFDIQFLDKAGKEIKDLGGRKLRWTFTLPQDLVGGVAYLGAGVDGAIEIINADYSDNTMTFIDDKLPPKQSYMIATADYTNTDPGDNETPDSPETGIPSAAMALLVLTISAGAIILVYKARAKQRGNQ